MTAIAETRPPRPRRGFVALCVSLFERWMPDPFVIAIALTLLTALAAWLLAPNGKPDVIIGAWYAGIFKILTFAFQMILILVAGHALANAPPVKRGIVALVALARTPNEAVVLVFLTCAAAAFLNWGFGLVICAMVSREMARHMKVDFGWIVAAAYSGWSVWATGLSSSIALTQATKGSDLNIIEKVTGHVTPFADMVFRAWNVVPTLLTIILVPLLFIAIRPCDADVVAYEPPPETQAAAPSERGGHDAPARRADRWPGLVWALAAMGFAAVATSWITKGPSLDIDLVIFIFLMLGLALHGSPIAYVKAIDAAAAGVGSMILQYPIYGGIMGILTGTGLAGVVSKAFVVVASAHTLPFWSYACSLVIGMLVPSGGGHWAVQGPVAVPAAVQLGATPAAIAIAVAAGEGVADMLQPFFALPVAAMAGIGIQRVMGYTVMTFILTCAIWTGATLLLM